MGFPKGAVLGPVLVNILVNGLVYKLMKSVGDTK